MMKSLNRFKVNKSLILIAVFCFLFSCLGVASCQSFAIGPGWNIPASSNIPTTEPTVSPTVVPTAVPTVAPTQGAQPVSTIKPTVQPSTIPETSALAVIIGLLAVSVLSVVLLIRGKKHESI